MKQLLIIICLIGWMNSSFNIYAQTHPSETINQASDKFPGFTPPSYLTVNEGENNPLKELFNLLDKKAANELEVVGSISAFQKQSKFQLIIDKKGKIIDCEILESSNPSKDTTVKNFLSSANLFMTPPMINNRPCNAVGIFNILYMGSGSGLQNTFYRSFKHSFDFYPIITDDTAER